MEEPKKALLTIGKSGELCFGKNHIDIAKEEGLEGITSAQEAAVTLTKNGHISILQYTVEEDEITIFAIYKEGKVNEKQFNTIKKSVKNFEKIFITFVVIPEKEGEKEYTIEITSQEGLNDLEENLFQSKKDSTIQAIKAAKDTTEIIEEAQESLTDDIITAEKEKRIKEETDKLHGKEK